MKIIVTNTEKVLVTDTFLKKMKIKDLNNRDFEIKDLTSFIRHIKTYHSHGTSLHEENGFFFKVDDKFRKFIFSLPNKENNK